MRLKHLAGGDLQRIRGDILHALFMCARLHDLLDVRVDAFFESGEQFVLLVDRQRGYCHIKCSLATLNE